MIQQIIEQLIEQIRSSWSQDFSTSITGLGILLALYMFAELVALRLTGSAFYLLLAPIATAKRAWAEIGYLRSLRRSRRLKQWKRRYVSLRSVEARDDTGGVAPRSVMQILLESVEEREKLVVLGEPGSGKSTAMEALAYRLSVSTYWVSLLMWVSYCTIVLLLSAFFSPFFLFGLCLISFVERIAIRRPLPVFVELRAFSGGDMEQFLAKSLTGRVGGETIYSHMRFYAENGRLALIVDGINEMRWEDYNSVLYAWRECLVPGHYVALTPVIFTSRLRKDPSGVLGVDKVLAIQELSDEAVKIFLRNYGARNIRRSFSTLREHALLVEGGLGRNPYWLRMITHSGVYSPNQSTLLEKFCRSVIQREFDKGRSEWPRLHVDDVLSVLADVARQMTEASQVGASFEIMEAWLKDRLAEHTKVFKSPEFLEFSQATTLLRISRRENRIEFSHHLVQEFLTAYDLRHTPEIALEHLDEVHWWQSLLLLGALVQDRQQFLQAVLGDRSEASRILLSFILLETQGNPDAKEKEGLTESLSACLRDGLPPAQRTTLAELARIAPNPVARALQSQMTGDDPVVKRRVLELARDIGGGFGANLVCEREVMEDDDLMGEACQVLVEIGPSSGPPLVRLLGHEVDSPAVIQVLQAVGDKRITKSLLEMIGQVRRLEVKRAILEILGEIRDPEAVDPLVRMLEDSKQSQLDSVLVETLGKLGDSRALDQLRKTLKEADPMSELYQRSSRALQQIGGVQAVAPLLEGLRASNWVEREIARDVLRDACDQSSVPALLAALKDPSWVVRGEVTTILGDLSDRRAVSPLLVALWDRDSRVRWRAAEALGRLGEPDSAEELERAVLETESAQVVYAARKALERLEAPVT